MKSEIISLDDAIEIEDAVEVEQSYIIVKQLPIIEERLAALSAEIDNRLSAALALECTEENYKEVKSVRASINKEFEHMEEKRKQVKKAVTEPYEQFNKTYEALIGGKYKDAVYKLGSKTKGIEDGLKQIKRDELERYYNEICAATGVDFVPFSRWNPNVTLTASARSLKAEADTYLGQIADSMEVIRDRGEDREEVTVEFRRTLNLREAIETVMGRHKAVEEQKQRQAEQEERKARFEEAVKKVEAAKAANVPQALAPPVEISQKAEKDPDELLAPAFQLEPTRRADIKRLSAWLNENGIKYKLI